MISLLLFALLIVFLGVLLRDLILINKILKSLLNRNNDAHEVYKFNQVWTYLGRKIFQLLEALNYKLTSIDRQVIRSSEPLKVTINIEKSNNFYNEVLAAVTANFRIKQSAIVTYECNSTVGYYSRFTINNQSSVFSKNLEKQLMNFYEPFFLNKDESLFGLRDGILSNSFSGEFSIFGYRYVIAHGFNFQNHDGQEVRGLLWLGYSGEYAPSLHEVEQVKDLCQKIQTELTSSRIIHELSSKIDEAKKLDIQKTDFITHVSHDIRSPLHNIRAILNLIGSDNNKDYKEMIEIALNNSIHMEEIIEAILDFSRYQAGQLVSQKEHFNLIEVISQIVNSQLIAAKLKNLELVFKEPDANIKIYFDRRQFKRILNNLLSNAIKYTLYGSVKVSVDLLDETHCKLIVSDTGIGMTEDQLRMLFIPFTRFNKNCADGVGLGLTLTKALLELNGGKLNIRSKKEEGSEFSIDLKCESSLNYETHQVVRLPPPNSNFFTNIEHEVILIDDDALFLESFSRNIARLGMSAIKCHGISEAMSVINFGNPLAIISDLNMPDGGYGKLLSFLSKSKKRIPVCIFTGSERKNIEAQLEGQNIDLVLCKTDDFSIIETWLHTIEKRRSSLMLERNGNSTIFENRLTS